FWGMRHQRDFLVSLSRRWPSMSFTTRSRIETRLLRGPSRWQNEPKKDYHERRAYMALQRIDWLRKQGCALSGKVDDAYAKFKTILPDWTEERAEDAASSMEPRGGGCARKRLTRRY